jgi:hypothetical protein
MATHHRDRDERRLAVPSREFCLAFLVGTLRPNGLPRTLALPPLVERTPFATPPSGENETEKSFCAGDTAVVNLREWRRVLLICTRLLARVAWQLWRPRWGKTGNRALVYGVRILSVDLVVSVPGAVGSPNYAWQQ